jgi:hypothetical protein
MSEPEEREPKDDEAPEVIAHSEDEEETPFFTDCTTHSGGCTIN